jgi:Ser/Thr protein kinase RdoA (MazF antagonist)
VAAGGLLAVMQFCAGRHLPPEAVTEPVARQVGALLARVHRALRILPAGAPAVPDGAALVEQARSLLADARSRPDPDELDRLAVEAAEYRLAALQQRPPDPALYRGARWQVVHGDYYPGNLLFGPDGQITALLDFDFCGPRWRAAELGRAAVEAALRPDGFRPAVARALLHGYLAEEPVPELRSLFRFWYDYLLGSLYPLPLRYRDPGRLPREWQRLARRRHRLLLWLGEHREELEALAGTVAPGGEPFPERPDSDQLPGG